MSNSWKIGAISGLIAGIVGNILSFFSAINIINIGEYYWFFETLSPTLINKIIITETSINIIWGIVLGIVYSKAYDLVPGKGISKSFMFGLIYALIYPVRFFVFNIMYSYPFMEEIYFTGTCFLMGLVLGISYEFLNKRYIVRKEKLVTKKYDLKGAFHLGAFAGIVSGLSSFILASVIINPLLWPKFMEDVGFLLSQLGTNVMFNMIWGIVFGILYAMFYEKIPSKGILKGLIFSMVLYFFTSFQYSIRHLMYGYPVFFIWAFLAGLFVFVPFGVVIGLLYRKPSDEA